MSDDRSGRVPRIALIGLGDLAIALGQALQQVKTRYEIVGHDRESDRVQAALRAEAIDRGDWNLISVVEDADLVFLNEPLTQLLETLETIAPHLRPGTLVTDTASTKAEVMAHAAKVMPERASFIGGHPVLQRGADAGADAFAGAAYCLTPLSGASDDALRVLGQLVAAVGAKPFYIDAAEHDALVAGVRHVPYLLSGTLLRALEDSPSVKDLRRLSGPAFLDALFLPGRDLAAYREATLANAEALGRWVDAVITELRRLQDVLAAGDHEALADLLEETDDVRAEWAAAGDAVTEARGEAFEELEGQNLLRDLLFGRFGRSREERD